MLKLHLFQLNEVGKMNSEKINALINLLDDPDEEIYNLVRAQLIDCGAAAVPVLENACFDIPLGELFQDRLTSIIQIIQFDDVHKNLSAWYRSEDKDLLEGWLILSKYQYPNLDEEKVRKHIKQIQQDIWIELHSQLTALEQVKIMNHIFYDVHGFGPNSNNYYTPQNSFINDVLETKKGNPISLSTIYSIIGQRLGIPVFGVNLPKYFILSYVDRMAIIQGNDLQVSDILFYVNPFNRGNVFTKRDIDQFLKQMNIPKENQYYLPCSNVDVIKRMLANLRYSYEQLNETQKVKDIDMLAQAVGLNKEHEF